jgi:hypothetical protein
MAAIEDQQREDPEPRLLLVDEAASLRGAKLLKMLGWCQRDGIPCARVRTADGVYLLPLGVVSEILPGLLD